MINEPIQHEQSYPPSASAGGNNAYYLKGCEAVERSPSYAACLYKIGEIDAGRENVLHNDCAGAHRTGKCAARGMREQEQLHGSALYFFPRGAPQATLLPFKVAGDFGVRITNLTDPALIPPDPKPTGNRFSSRPLPPVKKADEFEITAGGQDDGYAAAITAAVAEMAVEPPKPVPAPPAPPKPAVVAPPPAPTPTPAAARPPLEPGETPLQYARRLAASRNK